MLARSEHLKVLNRVVLFVVIFVMDVLSWTQHTTDHFLGIHTMLVPAKIFAIRRRLYRLHSSQLRVAIVLPPNIIGSDIINILITPQPLCMHPTEPVGSFFCRVLTVRMFADPRGLFLVLLTPG